eukprot:scaffold339025_cov32-Prasinocladus_malaysianus.AAC.1
MACLIRPEVTMLLRRSQEPIHNVKKFSLCGHARVPVTDRGLLIYCKSHADAMTTVCIQTRDCKHRNTEYASEIPPGRMLA